MTKQEKISYLAGFLDGDGHFRCQDTVNGRGKHYHYTMIIGTNTNKDIMNWLKDNFGGTIAKKYNVKEGHKPCWFWRLQGKKAVHLMNEMLPYLIVRKEQAIKALCNS